MVGPGPAAGPDILSGYDSSEGSMHLLAGISVALSLLTPSPEAAFEAWAIHRRAFDIAVNSLAPA